MRKKKHKRYSNPAYSIPDATLSVPGAPPASALSTPSVAAPPAGVAQAAAGKKPGKPRRLNWGSLGLGVVIGSLLAGGAAFFWLTRGPHQKQYQQQLAAVKANAAAEIKQLQTELETEQIEASNLRTGSRNLNQLLSAFSTDWDKPPEKPRYQKVSDGVLIYWEDPVIWRKYYLYQGKGDKGPMVRYNTRPQKKGFVYLTDLTPGLWRFSVSALNKEGKETLPGTALTLRIPLE